MTDREKLALLEDMLELDEGDLTLDKALGDIDEYDSMAKLSLIVLMEDEFGVKLTLEHVTDGALIVDELLKADVPLAIGPTLLVLR